ncbi:hypothetical protein ACQE3D_10605 [Methylomonas sp. MS20]|uniref:DUF4376 domain-containing protein n=1 Tax=unclassified Methylomonas TaxID=2608980 RepID=UPI0028A3633F|nr:hypothetical protein [Methylomonas sp. MV1]MDT4328553.1 hypothetical protein [Methylomonas sp. MV1]
MMMRYSPSVGVFYVQGPYPDDAIDVSDADARRVLDRQPGQVVDCVDGALVVIDAAIDRRSAKVSEINRAFADAVASGYTTNGWVMQCDIGDVQRLKSAYDLAILAGETALPVVVDYHNAVHADVALSTVLTMIVALGGHYQSLYQHRAALRAQVIALPESVSQAELDLIVW